MKSDCDGNGAFVRPSCVLLFRFSELDFFSLIPPDLKKMEGKDPLDPLAKTEEPDDKDVNNNGRWMVIVMVDVVVVAASAVAVAVPPCQQQLPPCHPAATVVVTARQRRCHMPPSYVPYKGTYVPYDGTFGAPDQDQTLDV